MSPSIWQILVVVLLIVVLFGRGKISGLMGDVARGIKSFKQGLADDPAAEDEQKALPKNRETDKTDKTDKTGA